MADTDVTRLQLSFKNAEDKTYSMSFLYPKANVTALEIDTTMDLIISKNIIQTKGGELISVFDGGLVNRTFTDLVE